MEDGDLVQRLERQVIDLVGSARGLMKEFEERMGESVHAQRLQASEARAEGLRHVKSMEEIGRQASELVREHRTLIEQIRSEWRVDIDEAAKRAGAEQAQKFGESMAGGLRQRLADLTAQAEAATSRMHWRGTLRAAGVAAGCGLGIIVAVIALLWWFVPSKADIEELQAQQKQLQASVADLNRRGGKIKLNTCSERGEPGRLCVLVDAAAGQYGKAQGGEVYMIAKGY